MNALTLTTFRMSAAVLGLVLLTSTAQAADPAPRTVSAAELAERLSNLREGSSYVRLRMEVKSLPGITKSVLQVQIKERRTPDATELVYQVLFPKARQGEAVLLRKAGNRPATGTVFVPPDSTRTLRASEMTESLFGTDLSYEDVVENFFAWDQQALIGPDEIDGIPCHILESRPGKSDRTSYTSVRTWVDARRTVPLRIEKYRGSGELARRINTTRIVAMDGRQIPANLTVRGARGDSITELDGSRIRRGVTFKSEEFTPDGLREIKSSRAADE